MTEDCYRLPVSSQAQKAALKQGRDLYKEDLAALRMCLAKKRKFRARVRNLGMVLMMLLVLFIVLASMWRG